ncbi:hypothetical protein GGI15_003222 [Coemansia interrupta]|uniref:Rad9-domain-containing protein n=1 Tax=Coemansia interrupta TaxID=1126814 RepID=A0A9W8LH42_9FUNG|nr:hypothetical protein GGI15_003222 [Coemansia interrupta]
MEAEIPAASLKAFYKALQCLSRVSSDISLEATEDQLLLVGVSASRAAHASFTFQQQFFDAYRVMDLPSFEDDEPALRCRVQAKLLVGIFKARGSAATGHSVEKCTLRIEQPSEPVNIAAGSGSASHNASGECRLVVKMMYKEGVCRTHRLFYETCDVWRSEYDKNDFKSRWRISAKVAASWIGHFARGLEEVSIRMSPRDILVRSWAEGHYAGMANTQIDAAVSEVTRALQTELTIDPADFDVYHLANSHGTELTFGLREFRAILQYAEAMALPLQAFFSRGGEPVLFSVGDLNFGDHSTRGNYSQQPGDVIAEFAVATIGEIFSGMTSATSTPASVSAQMQYRQSLAVGTFTPQANNNVGTGGGVDRRISQLSIEDAVTPQRALVCHSVDTIGSHTASPDHPQRFGSVMQSAFADGRSALSPFGYASSGGSHVLERAMWPSGNMSSANRSDSLMATPASTTNRSNARAMAMMNDYNNLTPTNAGRAHISSGNAALPFNNDPVAKSYRLLDMPRPRAPPGVTDSQINGRQGSAGDSDDDLDIAPTGRVQTRLPFQAISTRKQQSEDGNEIGGGDDDDDDDDEELEATPPPPSKRVHIV